MSEANVPATTRPEETPAGEAQPGFWRRVFGGSGPAPKPEGDGPPPKAETEELGPAKRPERPTAKNAPRAPKDDESQRRFARAAMLRREKLARAIGERVENVLLDRMAQGEQRLALAQEGVSHTVGEVKGLLGAIGRNLDEQVGQGERVARILEQLPAASEREREAIDGVALTIDHHGRGLRDGIELMHGALRTIERDLDVQNDAAERAARALETLPAVVHQEHEREHQALVQVRRELEAQRDQRERMIETLRAVGTRFDERVLQLEARLDQNAAQARSDASTIRLALESVSERISAEARAQSASDSARTRRIEQGLGDVSRRLGESNALHAAGITSQNDAMARMHDTHAHLMDALQAAQSRALGEVQRLHDEATRRSEQAAWRSRLALVGSAGLVAIAFLVGFGRPASPVVIVPSATAPAAPSAAPTSLPAGFRRAAPEAIAPVATGVAAVSSS